MPGNQLHHISMEIKMTHKLCVQEVVTHLSSKLLYKMGNYFLNMKCKYQGIISHVKPSKLLMHPLRYIATTYEL